MKVGDVFYDYDSEQKLVITFEKYDMFWGLWETGQSFSCWIAKDFDDKKYLGSSKGKLDNLFEVQDE